MSDEKSSSPDARLAWFRHEIRNSLNVLTGSLALLNTSDLTPSQQKHVTMCRSAVDRITATLTTGESYADPTRAREAAAELKQLGHVSFLHKPFERSDLLRQVQLAGGARKTLRLLSADDVPEIGWLLEALLANSRCTVDFVPDGRAAVDRAREGEFDVILLDLDMPIMDGHEAARAIRAREARDGREPVPILIVTGHKLEDALDGVEVDEPEAPQPTDPAIAGLVPGYLAKREADVEKLRTHIEAGAFKEIRSIGHKLKGTGRGYGFPRLSEIGRALEAAGDDRDDGRARAATDALEAFIARVRAQSA